MLHLLKLLLTQLAEILATLSGDQDLVLLDKTIGYYLDCQLPIRQTCGESSIDGLRQRIQRVPLSNLKLFVRFSATACGP